MSTYYYLACDKHKVRSDLLARQAFIGDWTFPDETENLGEFIAEHSACQPVVISEHDGRFDSYPELQREGNCRAAGWLDA